MIARILARRAINLTLCAAIAANALALALILASCGGNTDSGYGSNPPPVEDPQWTNTIQPLIKANCGGCHDGVKEPAFTSGAAFKASTAKAKIQSGAMPKGKVLDPQAKATMLAYLK